jgi:hypothetical protein
MQFNNFCRNLQREITQMTFNNISVLTKSLKEVQSHLGFQYELG